jgi:hypothetical protein
MNLTRALLLSSNRQAESFDRSESGILRWKRSRFLVEGNADQGPVRFSIFRVFQRMEMGSTRIHHVVADAPHVEKRFEDMDALIEFLRRSQIDPERSWEPVEEEE